MTPSKKFGSDVKRSFTFLFQRAKLGYRHFNHFKIDD